MNEGLTKVLKKILRTAWALYRTSLTLKLQCQSITRPQLSLRRQW